MLRATCVVLVSLVTSALSTMEGFIVGGTFASIVNHAHSAFLSIHCVTNGGRDIGFICGASIVNQEILLTAAHCLYGCNYESHIGIQLGSEHRYQGRTFATYSFIIHEDYDFNNSNNDICLLRVDNPLKLNRKAARVALMKKPPYNELATVAGWGVTDDIHLTQTDYLKTVTQKVMNRNDCLKIFRKLPKGTICAYNTNPNSFAAQGDSGSALVVRGYIQIGLVSFKTPVVSRNIVIYTDVGHFYNWINKNAQVLACEKPKRHPESIKVNSKVSWAYD